MDLRDPSKYDGGGWVHIDDLEEEIKMDDCDECDNVNRHHSMVSRKKRKKFSLES